MPFAVRLQVNLSAKKVAATLAFVAVSLALLSLAIQLDRLYLGLTSSSSFLPLFFLSREGGIATWYSLLLLLFCSALLATISLAAKGGREGREYLYWAGLSVVFLYLSADEGAEIHERLFPLGKAMLEALGLSATGLLARAWLVPAALVMFVLLLAYLRFFLRLPAGTRLLFAAAGAVFLTGAAVVEILYPLYVGSSGGVREMGALQAVALRALPNVEELLEMLGAVVFIYALMSYMSGRIEEARLHFK